MLIPAMALIAVGYALVYYANSLVKASKVTVTAGDSNSQQGGIPLKHLLGIPMYGAQDYSTMPFEKEEDSNGTGNVNPPTSSGNNSGGNSPSLGPPNPIVTPDAGWWQGGVNAP